MRAFIALVLSPRSFLGKQPAFNRLLSSQATAKGSYWGPAPPVDEAHGETQPKPQARGLKLGEKVGLAFFVAIFGLFLRPLFHTTGVRAGTAIRMDTPELVQGSALVLEGRVLSLEAVQTEDGLIETIYQLAVDRTYLGEDRFRRSVRIPGGVLENGQGMLLAGMPRLRAGEDVLLFLSAEGQRGVRIPIGLSQGRYRIETRLDGSKLAIREQAGLGILDPTTGRVTSADSGFLRNYGELVAEVEAAVNAKLAGVGK